MKKIICLIIIFTGVSNLFSQNNPGKTDPADTIIQIEPSFPGDIGKYLSNNLKYPRKARKNNIEGIVNVRFIIEKDGSVDSVQASSKIDKGEELEKEALRVVTSMPKWKPGTQNGRPVRIEFMLPIHFILDDN